MKLIWEKSHIDVKYTKYMKEFWIQNQIFIIVVVATLGLLFGGVFLFSRNGGSTTTQTKVEDTILIPNDSFKTGGITDGKYTTEVADAKVTLVEFGDYQCPACVAYHPLVKEVITQFSGKINFVFRNFPLPQHKNANISAYAVEAAGLQGKFWEMHDKVYESDKEWATQSDPIETFVEYAKLIGLDIDKFKKDMGSNEVKTKITRDTNDGTLIKVNSTPSFFLNGIKIKNPTSVDEFKKLIDDSLKTATN